METFTKHNDPGHGWLAVPVTLIDELGIRQSISSYSYIKGDIVYLEEDCDAYLFDMAMTKAGREFAVEHKFDRDDSPIRSYKRM